MPFKCDLQRYTVGELDWVFDAPDLHIDAIAVTNCTLWAIDGRTLRRKAATAMAKQREAWDQLVSGVHLLRALTPLQRAFLSCTIVRVARTPGCQTGYTDWTGCHQLVSSTGVSMHNNNVSEERQPYATHTTQFNAGDIVAMEGDEGEGVWMVMEGEAEAVVDLVAGLPLFTTTGAYYWLKAQTPAYNSQSDGPAAVRTV